MKAAILALMSASLVACSGGQYGHARKYAPTSDEDKALAGSEEFDPVMARRQPEVWAKKKVSLFGVVVARRDAPNKALELDVSLRTLEARNLCEDASEDSCRVTVSENEFDRLKVRITGVSAADRAGEQSIGPGSLVRVVGKVESGTDLVVSGSFYRHWPRGFYVTTAAATLMRR